MTEDPRWCGNHVLQETKNTMDSSVSSFDSSSSFPRQLDSRWPGLSAHHWRQTYRFDWKSEEWSDSRDSSLWKCWESFANTTRVPNSPNIDKRLQPTWLKPISNSKCLVYGFLACGGSWVQKPLASCGPDSKRKLSTVYPCWRNLEWLHQPTQVSAFHSRLPVSPSWIHACAADQLFWPSIKIVQLNLRRHANKSILTDIDRKGYRLYKPYAIYELVCFVGSSAKITLIPIIRSHWTWVMP